MNNWIHHSSKIAYQNNWIRIREDQVTNPAGVPGIYGVVELHHDSAYAVPVTPSGSYVLTRQFRYPIGAETWEFPSGQTDGQDPITGAHREMLEETGYDSGSLVHLSKLGVDTGLSSSSIHVILAQNTRKVTDELDPNDGIVEVKEFSSQEITDMIMRGDIICPHTISAFFLAHNYQNNV